MAEPAPQGPENAGTAVSPPAPAGGDTPPGIVLPMVLLTLGRVVVFAAIVGLLWAVGLGGFPGVLFGLLLSMPAAYVLLRPLRERVTAGLVVRSDLRRARKEDLRTRLAGSEDDVR